LKFLCSRSARAYLLNPNAEPLKTPAARKEPESEAMASLKKAIGGLFLADHWIQTD
jgi:hypothetical protein